MLFTSEEKTPTEHFSNGFNCSVFRWVQHTTHFVMRLIYFCDSENYIVKLWLCLCLCVCCCAPEVHRRAIQYNERPFFFSVDAFHAIFDFKGIFIHDKNRFNGVRKKKKPTHDPHEWWIYTLFCPEIYTFRKFSHPKPQNTQWNRNTKLQQINWIWFVLPSTWTHECAPKTIEIILISLLLMVSISAVLLHRFTLLHSFGTR